MFLCVLCYLFHFFIRVFNIILSCTFVSSRSDEC
nr:MAG TPA: hypothetical protein [Caudoviricetes sp.]